MLHFGNNSNTFAYNWQVWDYTGLGYTRYNARDVGKEHLGYAIIKATAIFYLYFFVSGHIFLFVFVSLRCVVENKVLCNSLLLRLQVCLFFNT
jgi:ubiquinone biosynthesis monooxygenase Coq6